MKSSSALFMRFMYVEMKMAAILITRLRFSLYCQFAGFPLSSLIPSASDDAVDLISVSISLLLSAFIFLLPC